MNYEESLMVKAAWYYYFENMTQQAIADRLSISCMRVIKLLDTARQTGVIQFRLRSDGVGMVRQSQQLINKYGLKDVFLIPEIDEDDAHPNESIARAGAMYSSWIYATSCSGTPNFTSLSFISLYTSKSLTGSYS